MVKKVIKQGVLYIKIMRKWPFWPFGGVKDKSLLFYPAYGDVTKFGGGTIVALLRINHGICQSSLQTSNQPESTLFKDIFQEPGWILRPAWYNNVLLTMAKMMYSQSPSDFAKWRRIINMLDDLPSPECWKALDLAEFGESKW